MPPKPTALLQGTLDLIVLQLLSAEPGNGYDLTLRIQATTRDALQVNAGSLYPALYRLEEQGWLRSAWVETPNSRRAKSYTVTAAGLRHLVEQRGQWARFTAALDAILSVT